MNKIDISALFEFVVTMAKPFIPVLGEKVHDTLERCATIPEAKRKKLLATLKPEDRAEGERLLSVMADSFSDAGAFFASRGAIEAD